MPIETVFPLEGGCDCGRVRYRMQTRPLIVHCCHCRWCQRETGSAFALNALIEAERLEHLAEEPELIDTPLLERPGPEDRPMPELPHRAVEQLFRRGPLRPLRAGGDT